MLDQPVTSAPGCFESDPAEALSVSGSGLANQHTWLFRKNANIAPLKDGWEASSVSEPRTIWSVRGEARQKQSTTAKIGSGYLTCPAIFGPAEA